jgi:hypothetical protein
MTPGQYTETVVPPYRVLANPSDLPALYDHYRERAELVEEFDLELAENPACFFAIGDQLAWPKLVVAQRYWPAGWGFNPGIVVVPETATAFIGAGERALAYRLEPHPVRLWIDRAYVGFWSWARHGDFVVMSAELELAAWTIDGVKRWTMFVEPPWEYAVVDGRIELDVMGAKSSFDLASGPRAGGAG